MADVITRFKLETSDYDSKLRNASKELSAIAREASKVKGGFDNMNKASIDAAKALGNTATSSTNAKDKVKELVASFNEAAKTYNKLTEEQKRSDWGKNLAESLNTLKGRIAEAKNEMQSLNSAMQGKGGGMGKFDGMLAVFGGNMMTKAVGVATSLASKLGDCVVQGIELAQAGEGVRLAFDKLNRPDLLDQLREATHGTVTDLELMKQAVKFNDFNLSLDEMGTMLAFAQQKAKDTGQSVDYMVDSIVTGLGRKSLMILDNLGLSAADIKEKMKGTGDMTKAVGEIIREQMSKAGDYVETAADRAARADAELTNAMEALGRTFQPLADAGASVFHSLEVGAINLLNRAIKPLIDSFTILGKQRRAYEAAGGDSKVGSQIDRLKGSNYKDVQFQSTVNEYNRQINALTHAEDVWNRWRSAGHGGVSADEVAAVRNKYGTDNASIRAQYLALRKQRDAYISQANSEVFNPVVPGITPAIAPGTAATVKTGGGVGRGGGVTIPKTEEQLNSDKINALTQEYINATDERRAAIQEEIKGLKERNDEIKKLKDEANGNIEVIPEGSLKQLKHELQELQKERELLTDPIAIGVQDDAIDEVQRKIDALNGKEVTVKVNMEEGSDAVSSMMSGVRSDVAAERGAADQATMANLMKVTVQNGIDNMDIDWSRFHEMMMEGMDIPDEQWQEVVDSINEKLESMKLEPIKIDFSTGTVSKQAKEMKKGWMDAASAIQQVGQAMQGIEDPAAKVVGIIGEAIASIVLGYGQATAQAAQMGGPWGWIAFVASGLATTLATITAVKNATKGFAEGGMVPGNSYSGDNVPAMVNSGEIILNRAQQNSIASQLQSGGFGGMSMTAEIDGESLLMIMGNAQRRRGRSESVLVNFE